LVDVLLLARGGFQQVLRARQLLLGKGVLSFELGDVGLVEIDLGLVGRLFEEIEEVALLDFLAFDKLPLFEKRADPRHQRYPSDRLDATDELV